MSLLIKMPLMSPEDSGGGSAPIGGKDDDVSVKNFLLADDDEEVIDGEALEFDDKEDSDAGKEDEEGEDKEAKEPTLEEELEGELKADDEEESKDDDLEIVDNFSRRDFLKDFPGAFKKYPQLERSYYRDAKFTEVFATPAEAKVAAEDSRILDNFEKALLAGDSSKVFEAVKQQDTNAFHNFVDNLLSNLGKVDERAEIHVIRNVGKTLISEMIAESNKSQIPALQQAALILNQFLTGSSEFTGPEKLAKTAEKNPELEQLSRERQELVREKFNGVREGVINNLDSKVSATLNKFLDPKESMTPYMKKAALNDAKVMLQQQIAGDTKFVNIMKRAWQRAQQNNFSKRDIEFINNAYTNKARTLLPTVIKSVRAEALKGLGSRRVAEKENNEVVREPIKRGPVASGKSAAQNSGSKKGGIPAGMSTREFLMSDD